MIRSAEELLNDIISVSKYNKSGFASIMQDSFNNDVYEDAVDIICDAENELIEELSESLKNSNADADNIIGSVLEDRIYEHEYYLDSDDAKEVIELADEVETDTGLWEGSDMDDALITQARYTLQNELRSTVRSIVEDMISSIEDIINYNDISEDEEYVYMNDDYSTYGIVVKENLEEDENYLSEVKVVKLAQNANEEDIEVDINSLDIKMMPDLHAVYEFLSNKIDEMIDDIDVDEMVQIGYKALVEKTIENERKISEGFYKMNIEPNSKLEKNALQAYFELSKQVSISGYPLGGSYIDARCGNGYSMPNTYYYNKLDKILGNSCKHLRGMRDHELEEYFTNNYGYDPRLTEKEILRTLYLMSPDDVSGINGLKGILANKYDWEPLENSNESTMKI